MEDILQDMVGILDSNPPFKKAKNYLDLKNGKFDYRVSFPYSADPSQKLPTFKIQNLEEENSIQNFYLESFPNKLDFKTFLDVDEQSINSRIVDHIVTLDLNNASLKLLQNKNNQLKSIEKQLVEIMKHQRIDSSSFSSNCLTNICKYDFQGNVIDIETINIDIESKRYVEDQLVDRAPHPIRVNKKKKINKKDQVLRVKTQEEIFEELKMLSEMSGLLKIKEKQKGEAIDIKQLLDVVSLSDKNDYNDFWEEIQNNLSLKSEKNEGTKKVTVNQKMDDDQFKKVIDRIMKEATQYEQEVMQVQEEPEEEEEVEQQQEIVQKQNIEENKQEPKLGFEATRIQKKNQVPKSSTGFQNAVEDTTDLEDFYDILPKEKFAIQYPFELDEFQKRSILHLERKQSVFVAAHTSAGKTVVAEYGIALALKHKRKVIYTSPIKALSNQKYRELSSKFDSVGIVTGDVSLNSQASCVIMTTQILRNNLYRGAQMIRDIQWVIFDEIHYINNQDRGVVWEETIIMLPEHIGIIMLSATVPNYMAFANWVGRTKRRIIYVMKTFHRPVPLEHSLFIFGKFHVIKEANGGFLQHQYNQLKNQINGLARSAENKKQQLKADKRKKIEEKGFYNDARRQQRVKLMNKNAVDKFIKKITKADLETSEGKEDFRMLEELIADCHKKKLLPCVVFTFSKKKINAFAEKIYLFDLNNNSEKSKIRRLITHALSTLKPEDREIEQFSFLTEICMNGYAIHHGDLLPLAKEIVELLFSQGLIKVLFATETFAMGINMPTKTVIYSSIKKVTGSNGGQRFLNSSQYVQMSGRAGRRGLDEKGTVIIIVKDPGNLPEAEEMKKMIDHPGERLESKFKVTYQIILNLYNSKDINVQEMMRQSFMEDPKFSEFTSNIKKVKQLKSHYEELSEFQCPYNKLGTKILMEEYVKTSNLLRDTNYDIFKSYDFKKLNLPKYGLMLDHNNEEKVCLILRLFQDFRQRGEERFVQVMYVEELYLGMEITKEQRMKDQARMGLKKKIVLKFEVNAALSKYVTNSMVEGTNNQHHYYLNIVKPQDILEVYNNKVNFKGQLDESKKTYAEIARQLLNIPKNLVQSNFQELTEMKNGIFKEFVNSPCHKCEFKEKHFYQYEKRMNTKDEIKRKAAQINTNQLGLMGSFQGMLKLLNDFSFINDNSLTLKGRVARQVDIYVAQIIVEAVLDPLNPAQIAALLSAFVCDYKPRPGRGEKEVALTPFDNSHVYTVDLDEAVARTHKIILKITDYEINNEAYINPLGQEQLVLSVINFHLADAVYKWAIGYDFVDAAMDTKAPEGTIVKTIVRLNMLLSNVKSVCRILGSSDLEKKIDSAVDKIKRDIVFSQSLYLSA